MNQSIERQEVDCVLIDLSRDVSRHYSNCLYIWPNKSNTTMTGIRFAFTKYIDCIILYKYISLEVEKEREKKSKKIRQG